MTGTEEYRKIEGTCDCCLKSGKDRSIVPLEGKDYAVLCENCLKYLKYFINKYTGKWSEITA